MDNEECKDSFSVDDIHELREEHYDKTKDFSKEEIIDEVNKKAEKFKKGLNKNNKKKKLAM